MLTTIDQFAGQDIWVYAELESEDAYIRIENVFDDGTVIYNAWLPSDSRAKYDLDEILYGELTGDIDSIEIHPLDTITTDELIAKFESANGVTASKQFTKYPQGYVKASRHWREKTECKTKNGKIVRMQNVSSIFNEQDYYILYDADGNFVEKSLDFNDLHDKLYGINASTSVEASFDINPYMKDLVEYLDYLSDDEIADIKIEHIDDGYEPEAWIEIPEHLRSTVENAVGVELCSPNEAYWYQIEYHPDDDSIVFGINTDLNLETLRGVSKQTEDRFKDKFKKELGESVFSTSTIKASSDNSDKIGRTYTAFYNGEIFDVSSDCDALIKQLKAEIDDAIAEGGAEDIDFGECWVELDSNEEVMYIADGDSDYADYL